MAYLWFNGSDRVYCWRVRLDDGSEWIARAVFSLSHAATVTDGKSRGLAVDHVLRFDETEAQLIDAKAVPVKAPRKRR